MGVPGLPGGVQRSDSDPRGLRHRDRILQLPGSQGTFDPMSGPPKCYIQSGIPDRHIDGSMIAELTGSIAWPSIFLWA